MPVSFDDDKAAGQIVTMYQERRFSAQRTVSPYAGNT